MVGVPTPCPTRERGLAVIALPTCATFGPDRVSPGQSPFFLSVPSLNTRRGMLRCRSFPPRYPVAIPLLTAAFVGFAQPQKARHHRQATTGSQFVTAPKFGSGPSDSALRRTPCHCCLPHLNESTRTGQTFTNKNSDLPVALGCETVVSPSHAATHTTESSQTSVSVLGSRMR